MISPPTNQDPIQVDSSINPKWQKFFSAVFNGVSYTQQSGITADRPTKGLFPGRFYFDTSLAANGKPIWVNKNGTGWVDATGAAV